MECIRQLENDAVLHEIAANVPADSAWLFVGCGTSYYLALSAAASFSVITGTPAQTVRASEVLLFPHIALAGRRRIVSVLISRSGRTTEVVKAIGLSTFPIVTTACSLARCRAARSFSTKADFSNSAKIEIIPRMALRCGSVSSASSGSDALTREKPLPRRWRIAHSLHMEPLATRSYFSQMTSFTLLLWSAVSMS